MTVIETKIKGLYIIEPTIFGDKRGYFFESFNAEKFKKEIGADFDFVQDNESLSQKNVLRGLHFQAPPHAQGKLVRVSQGAVLDVAVDIRKDSSTYGQSETIVLSEENKRMFWIPPGFAHGFVALEDNTKFLYKCTSLYAPESEGTITWDDVELGIDWKVGNPIISEKDLKGQEFSTFVSPF